MDFLICKYIHRITLEEYKNMWVTVVAPEMSKVGDLLFTVYIFYNAYNFSYVHVLLILK